MFQLTDDLMNLYRHRGIRVCDDYKKVINKNLISDLSYTSPIMYGLVKTTFQSHLMMAFNLMQNAIDEAKGAARIRVIADKYAGPDLKKKMLKHIGDEMRHSNQFANLIPETGYDFSRKADDELKEELEAVFDFDDDLKFFIFRVHSIEIRSWTMLRIYLSVLEEKGERFMMAFQDTIKAIMADEINHVCYTGEQASQWIEQEPSLCSKFEECIHHTNNETWVDISNMSLYMAENGAKIRKESELGASSHYSGL